MVVLLQPIFLFAPMEHSAIFDPMTFGICNMFFIGGF